VQQVVVLEASAHRLWRRGHLVLRVQGEGFVPVGFLGQAGKGLKV